MLPRNSLGRNGPEVSLLGFGAEAIGRKGRSFEDAQRTLNGVLEQGITLIDTASSYGSSEEFIGRALGPRHAAGEFTIVTKCGWDSDWQPRWKPAELAASIAQSLQRLRVTVLDVLLLHSCDLDLLKAGEVIGVVQQARDKGQAKQIGYSGDNQALRFAIDSGAFDVIECSYSMLDQANGPAIEAAAARGMGVLLKRPIANAVIGAAQKPRSEYAAQYWPRWEQIKLAPGDVGDLPWVEAAIRFSAYRAGVTCALIGSSNAEHMRLNAQWLENGPLPASALKRVNEAYRRVGQDWPALG